MVIVGIFFDFIGANMAANYLRQHGIDCFIVDEYASASVVVPMVEIRVMVDKKDLNEAKIILADFTAGE